MEVIKCEGNVMWAEFKCTDFVALIFFFFVLSFINLYQEGREEKNRGSESQGSRYGDQAPPVSAG